MLCCRVRDEAKETVKSTVTNGAGRSGGVCCLPASAAKETGMERGEQPPAVATCPQEKVTHGRDEEPLQQR